MKCKYVLLNAELIRDILNFKYELFEVEKIRHNYWHVKSGDIGIGIFDKKSLRFLKELLWHRSFIKKN
jgi:hypothetical protein